MVLMGQRPLHPDVPPAELYLPAVHSTHGPPMGPVEPAAHWSEHETDDVLPGGEVLPKSHSMHKSSPEVVLYLPDTHMSHAPPFWP